jgi:lincosamide nucleotidyltransferase A/C/D/E
MAEMPAADAVDLYSKVLNLEIDVWIDGGWAVDALLGEQTRLHTDLDIVIQEKDLPALRRMLEEQGYRDVERDDTTPWNFVLGDAEGREVDVHAFVFDSDGNGVYGPHGETYPPTALSGKGTINGHQVRCISPEYLVKFHTGYEPHDTDFHDVGSLCERFGIEYPKEYAHLEKTDQSS